VGWERYYHTWRKQEMLQGILVQCPNERDYLKTLSTDGRTALNEFLE
jgi:hypothetical protein